MFFITPAAAEGAAQAAQTVVKKGEMLSAGTAFVDSLLGYLVVFIGLTLLMLVIMLVGKIMVASAKKKVSKVVKTAAPAAPAQPAAPAVKKELAPGSAGDIKLYDTDPRDAAMIMAIVANKLGKPLNELRFISIREVK